MLLVLFSLQTIADRFHQLALLIVYASSIKIAFSVKERALGWHQLLNAFNSSVLLTSLVIAREATGSFHAKELSIVPAYPKEVVKDLGSLAYLSCTTTRNSARF